MRYTLKSLLLTSVIASFSNFTSAANIQLEISVENLAPANSVSFAPLRFGFGNGTFDTFDAGLAAFLLGYPTIADAPIVTIAEGGSGSNWLPAFAAADATADLGSVLGPTGPFTPGSSNSAVFTVDTANQFFTFGSMVVPSNDRFVGNDNPGQFQVFDAAGNLILPSIVQKSRDIWDAGSETDDPANAAFLLIGVNDQRVDQNGVVTLNSDFSVYNGLTTAAGYTFDSTLLSADSDIFRISFAVVPEPSSAGLLITMGCAMLCRIRREVARKE